MSKDRYYWSLNCSGCGKDGKAYIIENDGWSFMNSGRERHVQSVPKGFTIVDHGRDGDEETIIKCDDCGINALAE